MKIKIVKKNNLIGDLEDNVEEIFQIIECKD